MIIFEYPRIFWLLLLPLIVFFLFPRAKRTAEDSLKVPFLNDIRFIQSESNATGYFILKKPLLSSLRLLYLFSLWLLLVVALARPQEVGEPYRLNSENRDIMLVIDISTSMLQPDLSTKTQRIDRLTAVKAVVNAFIQKRIDDRIGLILFGTRAYLQAPLTFDKQAISEILLNTDAGMAGNSTAIGDALGLALKNLREEKDKKNKVIILLTDGENNDGSLSMAQAINLAEKEGIKIYTVGVGADSSFLSSLFSINNNELDEKSLKELAARTKGNYFRARNLTSLADIYNQIDRLEPARSDGNIVQEKKDLFYFPLTLALILAALLLFLPTRYLK